MPRAVDTRLRSLQIKAEIAVRHSTHNTVRLEPPCAYRAPMNMEGCARRIQEPRSPCATRAGRPGGTARETQPQAAPQIQRGAYKENDEGAGRHEQHRRFMVDLGSTCMRCQVHNGAALSTGRRQLEDIRPTGTVRLLNAECIPMPHALRYCALEYRVHINTARTHMNTGSLQPRWV